MKPIAPAPRATAATSTPAYQLHVELEGVSPKVWRRLLVPATIDLSLLHVVLLWGMGWEGGHLHEFVFGRDHYGPAEPDLDLPDEVGDEDGVLLRDALRTRKTFLYVYDYGDNWRHKVRVEKVVTPHEPIDPALCIAGENACPPEDVGGVYGYQRALEVVRDRRHPDHEDMTEWLGPWDAEAFDVERTAAWLRRIR